MEQSSLLMEIEKLRLELNRIDYRNTAELLAVSRVLDELILQYHLQINGTGHKKEHPYEIPPEQTGKLHPAGFTVHGKAGRPF
ncbi:MAG: aspartyl-phosphate phosphatase Spo0E family protein [Thermoanaerobacteraceae bacterium]|nr:aspartyl-phosphate phosphatase Spo0E family protein [Thermoanaerobacteraceae bacterium]